MSANKPINYEKLTIVQLKGALARRGLASSGTREELKIRLLEHDKKQLETAAKKEKEKLVTGRHILCSKLSIRNAIEANHCVRTVIIDPFDLDMMRDVNVTTWMNEARSFNIIKNHKGKMAAELEFNSCDAGEVACSNLTSNLSASSVKHPLLNISPELEVVKEGSHGIDKTLNYKPQGYYWERILILEGLTPDLNTEEKLQEYFPEALNVISFEYCPDSKGSAVLEFFSEKECKDYYEAAGDLPIQIGEAEVLVSPLQKVLKKYPKNLSENLEKSFSMTDKERLILLKDLNRLNNYIESMAKVEVNSQEEVQNILNKFNFNLTKRYEKRDLLKGDTLKRCKGGSYNQLPEAADGYLEPTICALLQINPEDKFERSSKYCDNVNNEFDKLLKKIEDMKKEEERMIAVARSRKYQKICPEKAKKLKDLFQQANKQVAKFLDIPDEKMNLDKAATKSQSSSSDTTAKSTVKSEKNEHLKEDVQDRKLFVGNLDKSKDVVWLKERLKKHFPTAVSVSVPLTRANKVLGFGFVEFKSQRERNLNLADSKKKLMSGRSLTLANASKGKEENSKQKRDNKDDPPSKVRKVDSTERTQGYGLGSSRNAQNDSNKDNKPREGYQEDRNVRNINQRGRNVQDDHSRERNYGLNRNRSYDVKNEGNLFVKTGEKPREEYSGDQFVNRMLQRLEQSSFAKNTQNSGFDLKSNSSKRETMIDTPGSRERSSYWSGQPMLDSERRTRFDDDRLPQHLIGGNLNTNIKPKIKPLLEDFPASGNRLERRFDEPATGNSRIERRFDGLIKSSSHNEMDDLFRQRSDDFGNRKNNHPQTNVPTRYEQLPDLQMQRSNVEKLPRFDDSTHSGFQGHMLDNYQSLSRNADKSGSDFNMVPMDIKSQNFDSIMSPTKSALLKPPQGLLPEPSLLAPPQSLLPAPGGESAAQYEARMQNFQQQEAMKDPFSAKNSRPRSSSYDFLQELQKDEQMFQQSRNNQAMLPDTSSMLRWHDNKDLYSASNPSSASADILSLANQLSGNAQYATSSSSRGNRNPISEYQSPYESQQGGGHGDGSRIVEYDTRALKKAAQGTKSLLANTNTSMPPDRYSQFKGRNESYY